MTRVVAIVQARMASTRLPGKVLADLLGEPLLVQEVARVRGARLLDDVAVATSDRPQDDAIAEICRRLGWTCVRGSEADVLDRYVKAARQVRADVVVRLTADCPLLDGDVVDQVIAAWQDRQPGVVYASNAFPDRTFPHGLDVEVVSTAALEEAAQQDREPSGREHVTLYVKNRPARFPAFEVNYVENLSDLRWTVDTREDLELVRTLYGHFGHARFGWQEAVRAHQAHPEWSLINGHVRQKTVP